MDESVSERVIQNVSNVTSRDELDLPPLYGTIDPDALDEMIAGMTEGKITFEYAGCEISVTADARVRVMERRPSSPSV